MSTHAIVLFDGVCNLCNGAVQFIIDRDRNDHFRFASLQSETGARILAEHGRVAPTGDPESIVLVENGVIYERSSAALRIARHLGALWPLLFAGVVVPRFLRDAIYKYIARNRYRWFGKSETCRVPTAELRGKFLQ